MKTIKVRIACAASEDGEWVSSGWKTAEGEQLLENAIEGLSNFSDKNSIVCWIEAEVPVPESQIIKGEVKMIKNTEIDEPIW
jgi:hypothetical protein